MSFDETTIRELHRQENELMNHRMSWFLTLQGFLFAALAFGWEKGSGLIVIFGIVGVMSSFSVGILLRHAVISMKNLQKLADDLQFDLITGRKHEENSFIVHLFLPWHFLPILFSSAWFLIIIIKFTN